MYDMKITVNNNERILCVLLSKRMKITLRTIGTYDKIYIAYDINWEVIEC